MMGFKPGETRSFFRESEPPLVWEKRSMCRASLPRFPLDLIVVCKCKPFMTG
ncbi:hypothetical protein Krac_5573 [Ktedonobacter racemifer DSM 44963]|uniref:Uncharacterized protein n=1 Tax=Ktedonobacter racemifer DSM 44963 TaxID=485913 RepID=D6TWC6_KTERA|nr:hypothetical protein Krac_5573 [Ktedonobacter racemifer DSM 44963]